MHDELPHARRAGEDQVVEGEAREGHPDVGPATNDRDEVRRKDALNQLGEGFRRMRDELARLEHGAVPRGEGADERSERELHGVVPRSDDPDDAERLGDHFRRRREKGHPDVAGLGPHPVGKVGARVTDLAEDDEDLRREGLVFGAIAEVARDGVRQLVFTRKESALEELEPGDALGARRGAGLPLRSLEGGEERREIGDIGGGGARGLGRYGSRHGSGSVIATRPNRGACQRFHALTRPRRPARPTATRAWHRRTSRRGSPRYARARSAPRPRRPSPPRRLRTPRKAHER